MNKNDLNPLDWPVKTVELTEGYIRMLIKAVRFYLTKNISYMETSNFQRFMDLDKYLQEFIETKKEI